MAERASERVSGYTTIEPRGEELDTPRLEWITIEHPNDVVALREEED